MRKKGIVLLSGGLDSTTTLYYALNKGYECFALIFDYGQRHKRELRSAVQVAKGANVPYKIIKIKLPWGGSSLLGTRVQDFGELSRAGQGSGAQVPMNRSLKEIGRGIPSTYVPARNTIFLSFALSYAEAIGAKVIFIGANAIDFSGYPDCRLDFYKAFEKVIKEGTKARKIKIVTPLINLTKSQIVKLGNKLGAPLTITWSCYKGGKKPCGVCDSCKLRERGFRGLGKRN